MKVEQTECSETSAYKLQTPGNYPKESIQQIGLYIKRTNVMQLGSIFICNCNIALHVSDAFCFHLQEPLETVEAACGE